MPRSYTLSDKARADRLAQKQTTRRALLDAARALIAERGVDGVSVVEVGRRAGVSHSLINAYFDGKSGLIREVVKDFNAPQIEQPRIIAQSQGSIQDRLRAIFETWARFDLADPTLLRVLQAHTWGWSAEAEEENRRDRAALKEPIAQLIVEGRESGLFRPGPSPDTIAEAILAIYTWGMRDAIFSDPIPDPEKAIAAIWDQIAALLFA
ncbi:MAG: hypothetical protein RLZZ563_448 [Pseudomonadota bacterium]|jgi:AcrR family transcriptional regulator